MNWAEIAKTLKPGEHVMVAWSDASSTEEWHYTKDDDFCFAQNLCETNGFILKADEKYIVIHSTRSFAHAQDKNEDKADGFMLTLNIPSGCITKIHRNPKWGETIELS
ncbi:hypothetical protein LCGC14_0338110 [marine sediment metagenome]|uniref:Uncharacterized protein n=1 Tax=marine sediment metagenome TaxID=412755 RepID=A0A0F9TXC3_9ZZZZ